MVMAPSKTALPTYTRNQEAANSISHAIGAILAIIGTPLIIVKAASTGDVWSIVSASVFMVSMTILYLGSAVYHGLPPSNLKRVWRVLDHDNVFILIMGTYTPYCLVGLRNYSPYWAWPIFGCVMALGIVGIVLNSIDLHRFRIFSMIDYLLMGWCIIISFYPLSQSIGLFWGTMLLLLGGISYTIGAVLYGVGGKKNQWFHFIFHIFVMIGTTLMYFSLYYYVF